ncbi:MAG: peptide-methionine (S)-S-oxide reductase MsrA, partial [Tissierellia bacterium]|nr:peptide-methionine (S)-S-oxide reductase MsrA [Tissierellia bacterium]
SLEELLNRFWKIINPTIQNRQGPDIGSQYRTGIYYIDEKDLEIINKTKEEQQEKYKDSIVTEIEPLKVFYNAEEYHQKYLKKNPGGYCHIDLSK